MAIALAPHCFRLLLFLHCFLEVFASSDSDSDSLLSFKDSLQNSSSLLPSWSSSTAPCSAHKANWEGVLCSQQGEIWGLKLENMGLKGVIDVDSLKNLPDLRSLSFMNNDFDGPIPDIGQLGALKSIYLSNNRFIGEIDTAIFSRMQSLKKVDLANNQFMGVIPQTLALLPKLILLRLEGNQFQGQMPHFSNRTWVSFNVSNNQLDGQIPPGLGNLDPTSFSGNEDLCGLPLKPCPSSKPSIPSIVVVVVVVVIALCAIVVVIIILSRRKQTSTSVEDPRALPKEGTSHDCCEDDQCEVYQCSSPIASSASGKKKGADKLKVTFVRDDRVKFDMQDLLRASAEMLGSGRFGSCYKAALLSGPLMVVKRFKQMNNVGREEFQQHMRRLGRLRHPSLLPLVAYYYNKEEKLLLFDYMQNATTLAFHLHGTSADHRLDWRTRLRIVKGVATGVSYLQNELPSLIASHGHLKSSNVLLKAETYEPLLCDYGLIPLMNQEVAQQLMVAYKSPEYLQHGRITKKTDVWSLGILILQILTAKEEVEDLASWVSSVSPDQYQDELFDTELVSRAARGSEDEMVKLLKIGMGCCHGDVEKRLDMREAVEKIEELKEISTYGYHETTTRTSTTHDINDEDFYSSCASEMDMRSSRAMSDEFINISFKS
ncbi:Mitogen-activated protein kinase kinase kinase [Parasponia andersonii]|uniref:Mitogen-activated protein kinase kinase kinase n=1 Tax=Parasponia andersonii TaxID=3476 RepID=A0A2P5AX63_PARAD|nr:Mitogen-activated protein kinase kinase kinase [Parasponia andersonii]